MNFCNMLQESDFQTVVRGRSPEDTGRRSGFFKNKLTVETLIVPLNFFFKCVTSVKLMPRFPYNKTNYMH
jgi:hypothetical protein